MKKKYLFLPAALAVFAVTALVTTCRNMVNVSDGKESGITPLGRALTAADLNRLGYMGGSVFYNPENPGKGHLAKGAVVAVRLGKLELKTDGEHSYYADKADEEKYGYITVGAVSGEKIAFTFTLLDKNGRASPAKYDVALDGTADLDGDGIADVRYAFPEQSRAAFPSAVHLTFLSSPETKSTAMFAVLTEQYANDTYPSGVIGVNDEGRFLYTKYEDAAATSRAAVTGIANGDFVLDIAEGRYVQPDAIPEGRAATAADLDQAHPVATEKVLQLAAFTAQSDKTAIRKSLAKNVVKIAKSNADYLTERDRIGAEFKEYSTLLELEAAKNFTDKLNEYDNVKVDAKMGLFGKFVLTWEHVECDLMSGAYVDGRFDLSMKKNLEETLTKFEKDMDYSTTVAIGPIPITLSCPISVKVPLKAKVSVDTSNIVIKFTGLYGAGVDINSYVNWNKAFSKGFITASAEPYAVSDGIFFLGVESDELEEAAKKGVNLALTVEPEVSVKPAVSVVVVEAGLEGQYKLTAGLAADVYADYRLTGRASLSHSGKIAVSGGVKLGQFQKKGVKNLYEFSESPLVNEEYTVSMKDIAKNMF
ncbi:MAG: hypothetical protein ACTTKL_08645 [Treponema sp.]